MCLAQGHNTVTAVRLEPVAPLSRVKHSTTEPLCSQALSWGYICKIALIAKHLTFELDVNALLIFCRFQSAIPIGGVSKFGGSGYK